MRFLILPLLLLVGCVSDSMMPATVEQVNAVRADLKTTAEIVAEGFNLTAPDTEVAFAAKHNADKIELKAEASSFDYLGESVMGLLMTSLGLGGVQVARKKIAVAKAEDPNKVKEGS